MFLPLLLHPESINERSALHDCSTVIPMADAHLHRESKGHDVALCPFTGNADSLPCLGNAVHIDSVYLDLSLRAPLRNSEIKRELCLLHLL